ncbi:MAG: TetR/AcrR family transcriptional regulator [Propylenella sp.]
MIDAAVDVLARRGFEVSTRELAGAMGVTQALIYRHFGSKERLIDATLEHALGGGVAHGQTPDLADADRSLEERLISYYGRIVSGSSESRMRLFIRAGLDGRSWPQRRGAVLTTRVFEPIITSLRREAGLPPPPRPPLMRGERELAMMLHASMVFLNIRRHVYGMPMPESLDDIVALYVRTFLAGALPAIKALHGRGEPTLTLPLAAQSAPARLSAPGRRRTSSR